MPNLRILVVGSGAIGAFFASRLHNTENNNQVSSVCRSNYNVISANGVKIHSTTFGEYTFIPEHVFSSVPEAAKLSIDWDYIVVATKALPDVSDDALLIQPLLASSKKPTIAIIQNGVGIEDPFVKRYPNIPLLSAVTYAAVAQNEPGVLTQDVWIKTIVGPFGSAATKDDAEKFAELLKAGGVEDSFAYDEVNLQMVRWHKVAINAAINPTTVLSGRTPNYIMMADPHMHALCLAIIHEIFKTAEAVLGIPIHSSYDRPERLLEMNATNKKARPSMLRDWVNGAPMELEVILANPIRMAKEKGVEVPRLETVYALLRLAQQRRDEAARGEIIY